MKGFDFLHLGIGAVNQELQFRVFFLEVSSADDANKTNTFQRSTPDIDFAAVIAGCAL